MATTTNYAWETPDDTDLVKDGAAAIRTLGSSVDTTTKALNPSTTLGDIEYRSATANTNTRLGIGSTGDILTVTGGVPVWAAPAGGGADYTLINTGGTALSGSASVTVSGISGKNSLFIFTEGDIDADASSVFSLRFNSDTGSNYSYNGIRIVVGTPNTVNSEAFQNSTNIQMASQTTGATGYFGFSMKLDGANATGIKPFEFKTYSPLTGAQAYFGTGRYKGSSTISSLTISSNAGNFTSGTLYIFGA
jgi:hypothetical protein